MINAPIASPRNVGAAGLVHDARPALDSQFRSRPHRQARSDNAPDLALDRLRQEPNIDLALQFDLNPCENLQALLATGPFNRALRDATTLVEAAARQDGSTNRVLNQAMELLAEGTVLRREVAVFRNALQQG